MNDNYFCEKNVLVLGGTGSIGSEIVKQLIRFKTKQINVFARDESKHQYLFDSLGRPSTFRSIIGDIRDKDRLKGAMSGIDIVFNAAALKAVSYCERNPFEAVNTNVIGTQNVVEVALEKNVEKVISISSDKAAVPNNTYGATKFLSERILASGDYNKGSKRTIFAAVRLGNVLGARNSVLPVIRNQIFSGHSITVVDSKMTRFVMTTKEATKLIFDALKISQGGEIFMLKMCAVNVWDLIDVYVEELCKRYNISPASVKRENISPRPGEKSYEKLFSDDEEQFTFESKAMLMLLSNIEMFNKSFCGRKYVGFKKITGETGYSSETARKLTKEEIRNLLLMNKLLI